MMKLSEFYGCKMFAYSWAFSFFKYIETTDQLVALLWARELVMTVGWTMGFATHKTTQYIS